MNYRLDSADRMWGYDGQWRNMCWHWELNPSYRWQASVSVEVQDQWYLTPLSRRSADIPLVSISHQSGLIGDLLHSSSYIPSECCKCLIFNNDDAPHWSWLPVVLSGLRNKITVCYCTCLCSDHSFDIWAQWVDLWWAVLFFSSVSSSIKKKTFKIWTVKVAGIKRIAIFL